MRRTISAWATSGLILCLLVPAVRAETEVGGVITSGEVQIGGRELWGDTESAKFDQYRDIRQGLFGGGRVLIEDPSRIYFLDARAGNIAQKDQQYRLEGGRWGHYRLLLDYSEIPQVGSLQGLSPFSETSPGVLTLPAGFNRNAFNEGGESAFLQQLLEFSDPVPLEFDTRVGRAELSGNPTPDLGLYARYRIIEQKGTRALSLGFGSPGGAFVSHAAPIDQKTHEVRVGGELVRDDWSLGLEYAGSFFLNELTSVTVDNPLEAEAEVGTSNEGRYALAPDNTAHFGTITGSWLIPSDWRIRMVGQFTYGLRLQNQAFLSQTVNSAIANDPSLALPKNSLDGRVQTILGNFVLTARPARGLTLKARYRIYDYDNQTDPITFDAVVSNDRQVQDRIVTTRPNSYRRQRGLLEASYRVATRTTVSLGLLLDHWHRSPNREVTSLFDFGPELGVNYRPTGWMQVRASYGLGFRRGNTYETQDSNQPELRKFSQADRIQNVFQFLGVFLLREDVDVTLGASFDLNDYDRTELGLTHDRHWNLTGDVSYRPTEYVGFTVGYAYDAFSGEQQQRNINPRSGIDAPWQSITEDQAHNATVDVDFVIVPDQLDAAVGYALQTGYASTEASGAPEAGAVDWPTISDTLQAVTATLNWHAYENITLRAQYRFEDFDYSNFQVNGVGLTDSNGDVYLRNRVAGYGAHVASFSAILSW